MNKRQQDVLFSSAKMDWGTPVELFRCLHRMFRFTLDACADKQNHKLDHYYDEQADGLRQCWAGERVFVNPPYGRQVVSWVDKALFEYRANDVSSVMLLPSRTCTRWFHDLVLPNARVMYVKGRVRFEGAPAPAPFPSLLAVFGFHAEFMVHHDYHVVKQGDAWEVKIV